jgi:hypothetical protein
MDICTVAQILRQTSSEIFPLHRVPRLSDFAFHPVKTAKLWTQFARIDAIRFCLPVVHVTREVTRERPRADDEAACSLCLKTKRAKTSICGYVFDRPGPSRWATGARRQRKFGYEQERTI